MILTIRTDKPEAELGIYDGQKRSAYETWQAHRELAETINKKIDKVLGQAKTSLEGIDGIVAFSGPGSFTGLRIGLSVANALAYSLEIPIVAANGEGWIKKGIEKLEAGENDKIALPKYGEPAKTTRPRK